MDTQHFEAGWLKLLCQPYGRDYTFDKAKESIQRNIYFEALSQVPGERWLAVVDWWIRNESRWPLLPDIKSHLIRLFPPTPQPLTTALRLSGPSSESCEPWQGIVRAWIDCNGADTIVAIAIPRLREWVQDHPHDLVEQQRLAEYEKRLAESYGGARIESTQSISDSRTPRPPA